MSAAFIQWMKIFSVGSPSDQTSHVARRTSHVVFRLILVGLLLISRLVAGEWSGIMVIQESLIGPGTGTSETGELEAYKTQLATRLKQARDEQRTQPPMVARIQRDDVAFFRVELERVVVATGGAVKLSENKYFIKGSKVLLHSGGLQMIADRAIGQAVAIAGGRRDTVALAPMTPPRPVPEGKPETTILGYGVFKYAVSVEGHDCQVLVAPDLPNPFSLACTATKGDDKGSLNQALIDLPGMPLSLEYASGDVRYRWEVVLVEKKLLDDKLFILP